VRIAMRIARDKDYQSDLRARILAASPVLFEYAGPTAALAEALDALSRERRARATR
jgi:hypothetical protein